MQKVSPVEITKWFINQDLDEPKNKKDGNIKLQKLLFFSQLIYMAKNNGKTMFDDEFCAFEHGMVLEDIRKIYHNNYKQITKQAKEETIIFPKEIVETLELTKEIFGNCSADELSDLSHEFDAWNKYYNNSTEKKLKIVWHNKEKSKVPYSELQKELYRIQKVLTAYEMTSHSSDDGEDY